METREQQEGQGVRPPICLFSAPKHFMPLGASGGQSHRREVRAPEP